MKVHRSNQELQDTIEGYKMLLEEQRKKFGIKTNKVREYKN